MNQAKFEKIEGREALKRLVDGENIYVDESTFFHLPTYNELLKVDVVNGKPTSKEDWVSITEFVEHEWFVKKPFDVRQALFDYPNEWVAAYNDERGKWIQVGFDTVSMRPIKAYYGYSGLVKGATAQQATSFELDACIAIEDVPEGAN